MTITYPNGTACKAIVLSHGEDELRAIAPGSDDVLVFTRAQDSWISEDLVPVAIEFEWQRRQTQRPYSEEACVCSQELAAHLIHTLFTGDAGNDADSGAIHIFSAEGARVAIHQRDLHLLMSATELPN